jgi:hypothetical protein
VSLERLVMLPARLGRHQRLIGLPHPREQLRAANRIVSVLVRVEFLRKTSIGQLDFVGRGHARKAEDVVVGFHAGGLARSFGIVSPHAAQARALESSSSLISAF